MEFYASSSTEENWMGTRKSASSLAVRCIQEGLPKCLFCHSRGSSPPVSLSWKEKAYRLISRRFFLLLAQFSTTKTRGRKGRRLAKVGSDQVFPQRPQKQLQDLKKSLLQAVPNIFRTSDKHTNESSHATV